MLRINPIKRNRVLLIYDLIQPLKDFFFGKYLKIFILNWSRFYREVSRKFYSEKVLANLFDAININRLIISAQKRFYQKLICHVYDLIYFVVLMFILNSHQTLHIILFFFARWCLFWLHLRHLRPLNYTLPCLCAQYRTSWISCLTSNLTISSSVRIDRIILKWRLLSVSWSSTLGKYWLKKRIISTLLDMRKSFLQNLNFTILIIIGSFICH